MIKVEIDSGSGFCFGFSVLVIGNSYFIRSPNLFYILRVIPGIPRSISASAPKAPLTDPHRIHADSQTAGSPPKAYRSAPCSIL